MKNRSPLLIRLAALALCGAISLMLTACGGQSAQTEKANTEDTSDQQQYPDVVEAELEPAGDEAWSLAVTISSPYDSPERYADGWRVLAPDETVLGEHKVTHNHANEQPFTRSQRGLDIPEDVEEIIVEGRDTENGYGGETVPVDRG